MAQFYICHPLIPNSYPRTTLETSNTVTNLLSASKLVSKAALKINEIPVKLQMAKIARFLEQIHYQHQNLKKIVQNSTAKSTQKNCQNNIQQTVPVVIQIPSLLNIYTSNSLTQGDVNVSCLTSNQQHFDQLNENRSKGFDQSVEETRDKQNNNKSLGGILKWREVVTKNVLEECDKNRIVRFKDDKCQCKKNQQDYHFKVMQKQLKLLKCCLQKIMGFFQNQRLITLQQANVNSKYPNYDKICTELMKSYRKFQEKQQFQINTLIQQKNKYLMVLQQINHYLKPNFNQDKTEKQNNSSSEALNDHQLERIQSQIEMIVKQINRLQSYQEQNNNFKHKSQQLSQKLKKYQMLLFIKDEQLQSLHTIKQNLQNRLSAISKIQQRPRSRSYKKFFEHLDGNLSSTCS